MRFQFKVLNDLPKLAWCAAFQKGTATVQVLLGPWVENKETFFCEGAWDGEFGKGEFAEGFMAGSGGKITEDGNVLFASPSHTLERLHSVRVSSALYVSNSLAFLLSAIDDKLDPGYLYYRAIFHSIRDGLRKCRRSMPTLKGRRVRLHYHCNLVVSPELTVAEIPKHMPVDFLSFEHYTTFLRDTTMRICRNAVDKERTITYQPIASISSGYDSPASAVLARAAGCSEAFTFRDHNDSGAEIARVLGMGLREYDRHDYLKNSGFPEAEFWAGGINAGYAVMASWERDLQQRLLVTGIRGDFVWDKNYKHPNCNIEKESPYAGGSTGESGLAEFRLRAGFIHLPLPCIEITSQPSIHSISNSAEMRPWSVGGDYDKPISRRIVEEAGVNRALFGQKKMGAWLPEEEAALTETSRSDFATFCSENWSFTRGVAAMVTNLFVLGYTYARIIKRRIESVAERAGLRLTVPLLVPRAVAQRLLLPIGKESLLVHWGISRISTRYRMPVSFKDVSK